MTEHPFHDYINIWRDERSYIDYCACCKVLRFTALGRVTHCNPKTRLPYATERRLQRRLNRMRGFTGEPALMVVWGGDHHYGKC